MQEARTWDFREELLPERVRGAAPADAPRIAVAPWAGARPCTATQPLSTTAGDHMIPGTRRTLAEYPDRYSANLPTTMAARGKVIAWAVGP